VLKRDNWRCVYCGARATEVHHKKYAKKTLEKSQSSGMSQFVGLVMTLSIDNKAKLEQRLTHRYAHFWRQTYFDECN
jgi:5-methylcytosine-specific restriction endonuclease McrA